MKLYTITWKDCRRGEEEISGDYGIFSSKEKAEEVMLNYILQANENEDEVYFKVRELEIDAPAQETYIHFIS